MVEPDGFLSLPADLPVPADDGGCAHLRGLSLPAVSLQSTAGRQVELSALVGRTVIYAYPMTGVPGRAPPEGWNEIPGARGCTPQSCGFRDRYGELTALGATVYGLSTNSPSHQLEAARRLGLPFELLSDPELALTRALRLPTFEVDGAELLRRFTLIVHDDVIEDVLYPVFPPDANADDVLDRLSTKAR